jgi:hypothetical protein
MSTIVDGVEIGGDFAEPKEALKPVEQAVEEAAPAEEVLDLDEGDEIVADGDEAPEAEKPEKKPMTAKERIQELVRKNRALERERDIEREVNRRLQGGDEIKLRNGATSGNVEDARVAPDPTDTAKYPLGSLDDRYIEDLTDWKVDQKLRAAQQRQLENDAQAEAQRVATENLQKGRAVVEKGLETYDDFNEVVWEAGMRGDYEMSEPTFHALTEAEHGADIAYALASNKAEAARVARLTPYQQIQYVAAENAKYAAKKAARKVPQAGNPPSHQARGASGRFTVDATNIDAPLGDIKRALFQR